MTVDDAVIYLCDSTNQLRNLARLIADEKLGSFTRVCLVTDDVEDHPPARAWFDTLIVLPASPQMDDPCVMKLDDAVKAVVDWQSSHEDLGLRAVVSCGEYTTVLAARLRSVLRVDGVSEEGATLFRDKVQMKTAVSTACRVPRYLALHDGNLSASYADLAEILGPRFVIKPRSMSSSIGVFVIDSQISLDAVVLDGSMRHEAEEYISGTQYHCEIAYEGTTAVASWVSRFNGSQLEMMTGATIGTMPLPSGHAAAVLVADFAIRGTTALGAANCVTHTEVIVTAAGEPVFIESAARTPGGEVIKCYMDTFGVDLFEIDMRLKSGDGFGGGLSTTSEELFTFWAYIARPAGRVTSFEKLNMSSSHSITWFVKTGDLLSPSASFEEPAGCIVAWNHDFSALSEDFEAIRDAVFVCTDGAYPAFNQTSRTSGA